MSEQPMTTTERTGNRIIAFHFRQVADEWERDLSAFKALYGTRAAVGRGSCVSDLRFRANLLEGAE